MSAITKLVLLPSLSVPEPTDISDKGSAIAHYFRLAREIEDEDPDSYASHLRPMRKYFEMSDINFDTADDEDVRKWFNSIRVPGMIMAKKPIASTEITVTATSDVSNMSALYFLLEGNLKGRAMIDAIAESSANLRVSEMKAIFSDILSNLQTFTDSSIMGDLHNITHDQYDEWIATRSKEIVYVGPYLFLKLAHQAGAEWSLWECPITKSTHFRMSRCGINISTQDKYMVQIDGEDQDPRLYGAFAKGLKIGGKQMALANIPISAYRTVDLFCTYFDVISNPKNKPTIRRRTTPPMYGSKMGKAMEDVKEVIIKDDTIPGSNADELIDWMARLLWAKDRHLCEAIGTYYNKQLHNAMEAANTILDACASMDKKAPAVKEAYIAKLGIVPRIPETNIALGADRKIRNRPPNKKLNQYLQKNVASVVGSQHIQPVDTRIKMESVAWKLNTLIDPDLQYTIHGYGVMYDHGGPAMLSIHGKENVIKKYDVNIPKNAGAHAYVGDVFDYRATGGNDICFDDALVNNIKPSLKGSIEGVTDASVMKVRRILAQKPIAAAMKISISSFDKDQKLIEWLVDDAGYRFIQVAKFGKLHNEEVFLIVSNWDKARLRCSKDTLRGDVKSCCIAIQVANKAIMAANDFGVRMPVQAAQWRKLLCVIPMSWPWYHARYTKKDPLIGGIAMIYVKEEETYEYDDVDAEDYGDLHDADDDGGKEMRGFKMGAEVKDAAIMTKTIRGHIPDGDKGQVYYWSGCFVWKATMESSGDLVKSCPQKYLNGVHYRDVSEYGGVINGDPYMADTEDDLKKVALEK